MVGYGPADPDRADPPRGAVAPIMLPSKDDLLVALYSAGPACGLPLCVYGRDLLGLYRRRRARPELAGVIASARTEIIADINRWVSRNVVAPESAPLHHISLGTVIDRVACAAELALHSLMTADPGSEVTHRAWTALAEVELEYGDLVAAVTARQRRLPAGDPP
ncbi:hypothetical protein [Nocardia sp. XZ_19_369]|uniref:hypothetical protein n=1 Tax=Nocardia sp. XZ_19_369 TaxID=2769487 RepID=UPI00189063A2|nr:hypothetical protein [Nocardia sp. XZ_19_369]